VTRLLTGLILPRLLTLALAVLSEARLFTALLAGAG
jgi:hypothetical protein